MADKRYRVPASKRALDLVLGAAALILLSPVMLLEALAVLIAQGPPLLFCQQRPGLGGELFRMCKFRTMRPASAGGSDEDRLTPLGRFLRRTSLDELPELFLVLAGRMSLVGPRPLLPQYLQRYTPEQARRHEVLPGITGWAQVNGRNAITWEQKFELDVWYVRNWSIWLDVRILLMTLAKWFSAEGVSQPGRETMEEFMGSDPRQGDSAGR